MPLSGFLVRWTGARPAMFTGCAIFSLGTALTYFTLEMVMPEKKGFLPIFNFQDLPWVALVFLLKHFQLSGSSVGGFHIRIHLGLWTRHRPHSHHDHWNEMVSQPKGEGGHDFERFYEDFVPSVDGLFSTMII